MKYFKIIRMKNSIRLEFVGSEKNGRLKQYHSMIRMDLNKMYLLSEYNGVYFVIDVDCKHLTTNKKARQYLEGL